MEEGSGLQGRFFRCLSHQAFMIRCMTLANGIGPFLCQTRKPGPPAQSSKSTLPDHAHGNKDIRFRQSKLLEKCAPLRVAVAVFARQAGTLKLGILPGRLRVCVCASARRPPEALLKTRPRPPVHRGHWTTRPGRSRSGSRPLYALLLLDECDATGF